MEAFALVVRAWLRRIDDALTPYLRQLLRFLGLPYCYLYLVDWKQCRRSPVLVAMDQLYIFFVLRYFPDNYSNCRLYELPRREWAFYYGSSYHPFQRLGCNVVFSPVSTGYHSKTKKCASNSVLERASELPNPLAYSTPIYP